jgi:hypothetical protein|tara:strand:+ start:1442 stop:2893 length:1452 start_codon:yes stop_codon:yes gene_type:complete
MAFNLDFLKDIGGTGANIFGAAPSSSLTQMKELGLLNDGSIEKANNRSLMKGLLTTTLGYLGQNKNEGHGNFIPYLARAAEQGVAASQGEFDKLGTEAMNNKKLMDMKREMDSRKLMDKIYKPGVMQTTNTPTQSISKIGPDGQQMQAPSFYTEQKKEMSPATIDQDILQKLKFTDPNMYNTILQGQNLEADTKLKVAQSLNQNKQQYARPATKEETAKFGTHDSDGNPAVWYVDKTGLPINVLTGTGTNVNINNAGESGSKFMDSDFAEFEIYNTIARDAEGEIAKNLGYISMIDDKELVTANAFFSQDNLVYINRLKSAFGIEGDDNNVQASIQNTASFLRDAALAQLDAGSKLKGQPSDKEQILLMRAAYGDLSKFTAAEVRQILVGNVRMSEKAMNDTNGTLGRMASDIKRKIDRTTNVQAKNNLKDELASIEGRMYQFEPREIKNAGRLSLKGNKVDTQKWLKLFKSEKETGFDGIID